MEVSGSTWRCSIDAGPGFGAGDVAGRRINSGVVDGGDGECIGGVGRQVPKDYRYVTSGRCGSVYVLRKWTAVHAKAVRAAIVRDIIGRLGPG